MSDPNIYTRSIYLASCFRHSSVLTVLPVSVISGRDPRQWNRQPLAGVACLLLLM
ncbi:hypothetical protein BRADI_2g23842v3 [Brachypodium distachyon]|uniref:Uncharacterized protein n=1 Tax=Brachypodium distachyon TaxID=15368 RepID=A0A2K2DA56_BRADI|nr:hypothetical protein BRADI_2g23842v3 [Brachypodium distachyon]